MVSNIDHVTVQPQPYAVPVQPGAVATPKLGRDRYLMSDAAHSRVTAGEALGHEALSVGGTIAMFAALLLGAARRLSVPLALLLGVGGLAAAVGAHRICRPGAHWTEYLAQAIGYALFFPLHVVAAALAPFGTRTAR